MSAATGMLALVHPVVRIVSFFVVSLFLALGNFSQFAVAVVLMAALIAWTRFAVVVSAWPMLRRMRWFFLSVLLIYAWLTPGQPLWSMELLSSGWMPSEEGVLLGGHRVLVLVMMVLAVQWLLWATDRSELVSSLYWLATPLGVAGISRERLAVRIALILVAMEQAQARVAEQLKQTQLVRRDLRGYAAVAASLVNDAVQQGESAECQAIEVDVGSVPALWQWLWPLSLAGVMLLAA